MRPSQDQTFRTFEGNNWFERNKAALERFDPKTDAPLNLIKLHNLRPRSALEIGAANGFRSAHISEHYGASVVALEPSIEALLDGKSRFPHVKFVQGMMEAIPFRSLFGLIIVNFVFHWIDRKNLLCAIAEVDRLLVDGGSLIVGDFYPSSLIKEPYHHLPDHEIYTYKQNYAATFLASGLYQQVDLITGEHDSKALTGELEEGDRIGTWLLRKGLEDQYVKGSYLG